MTNPLKKYDESELILIGGVVAALIGAATASGWAWTHQDLDESDREHRQHAIKTSAIAFGIAGMVGAAAATALFGPKAVGEDSWEKAIKHLGDSVEKLRDRL